jgi:hypothetical protein
MYRSIRIFSSSLLRVAIIILGLHSPAWGQSGSTTACVTGIVADEQGAIIGGATITARNIQTNFTRETQSGEDGSYLISQLPPGNYDLMVTAEGFMTRTSHLELVLGTTSLLNFAIKIGIASDIVEVIASDAIDEGRTESSTNNGRDRIENLPINRRNFMEFSLTSARVTTDRIPAQGVAATSGLSFNGQPARFNNITIDGLENNSVGTGAVRSTFSQDAVQEFQIVSDSYAAEFGRALGGIVNIVTKRGSNEYNGTLFFLNRNDAISARDVFSSFKPPYQQYQFGATLGGPVKRDRSFFFTSFERLSVKQNNIVTISDQSVSAARNQGFALSTGAIPVSIGSTTILARFDAQLTPNDTFYVRYNFGGSYNGALEPFSGLIGETNGGVQRLDDNTIGASNTYISASLNLVNETRFLYGRRNQDVLALDDGPQVRLSAPEGLVTFGRGGFLPQTRQERFYQVVNNVSLTRGRNQFKFGIDYAYNRPNRKTSLPIFPGGVAVFSPIDFSALVGMPGLPVLSGLQSLDPTLRTPEQRAFLSFFANVLPSAVPGFPAGVPLADLGLPLIYGQGFGDSRLVIPSNSFSTFFQDEIKLRPNLLLKAGVRYDINRTRFLPSNNGNFSPRIALSYRSTRLPRLNLHASYGLFFGQPVVGTALAVQPTSSGAFKLAIIPFPFSILAFALPGHRFPESEEVPQGVNFIPQLGTIFTYQRDLRASYTQQINTGLNYSIGNNTAIAATYDFVRGIKLFSLRNINTVVRPVPGSALGSLISGRVDPSKGDVNEYESAFDSYYHALTVSITRRFTNNFSLLAHYTFSKAIDNFVDIRSDQVESVDPSRPGDERGLSLQDVRSRFVLSGVWDLNYRRTPFLRDFKISTIINLNSGRPYNLLVGEDLNMNGDSGPPGDRPLGLGRNVGITPGFANIDLRLTRSVEIKEGYRLLAFIEVFNLFNRVNISEVDRFFPPDAQGNFNLPPKDGGRFIAESKQFRNAFAPRQFQFGLKVTF